MALHSYHEALYPVGGEKTRKVHHQILKAIVTFTTSPPLNLSQPLPWPCTLGPVLTWETLNANIPTLATPSRVPDLPHTCSSASWSTNCCNLWVGIIWELLKPPTQRLHPIPIKSEKSSCRSQVPVVPKDPQVISDAAWFGNHYHGAFRPWIPQFHQRPSAPLPLPCLCNHSRS